MADVPDENAGFDDNERGDETGDETEEGDLNAAFDHDENDDETWHDCHDCSDANPSDSNVGFDFAERDDVISHDDFEADWDARAMAAIADSNEPFSDHSDTNSGSETESPYIAEGSGGVGAKRKRGGLADKQLQAIQVSAVDAVDNRIRVCSSPQCCVKSLVRLDSSQRLHFVQSVQQIAHGRVGETVAVTKRQLLFAKHVFSTGDLFRISSTLMTTFILALSLPTASYPLQGIETTLLLLNLSDFVVCASCIHALCNIRKETTDRAVQLSENSLTVEIIARQTGHVAKSKRSRKVFNNALTFWIYWLTPDNASRPETLSEPIPGRDPYLRLLFSSYCAAYTFFIAAWDTRNGEVPKAGTSDAVLVLLGTNLNRRRKLIQRGYPDVPFINNLPCRLRSFNKGTRLSTRRLRR
jgi:hypothetical protein